MYESIISPLLVAFYQLLHVRVDPFGTRHIITTPRCIAVCVFSWVICGGMVVVYRFYTHYTFDTIYIAMMGSSLAITCACYILIYYGVTKMPCNDNIQIRQKKAGNKRILRTFGLILGTSVACRIIPLIHSINVMNDHYNSCLELGAFLMTVINCSANSLIYWWRLKEFRSAFSLCSGRRVGPVDLVV